MDNVLQESGKLCREFQRNQVNKSASEKKQAVAVRGVSAFALLFLPCPVIETRRIYVGAEEETAGMAGAREHPQHVGAESGAGGQRDDWVGHFFFFFILILALYRKQARHDSCLRRFLIRFDPL